MNRNTASAVAAKLNNCWFAGIIVFAGIVAYANSFAGVFVFDGVRCIVNSESIRSLEATWQANDIAGGLQRRPVTRWSFALNYAVHGLDTWGYHFVNLAIHLVAALLLFDILRRSLDLPGIKQSLRRHRDPIAFGAALLWTVHPLQTESVTYVIQRLESMMGMLYLACLYCVLRGARSSRSLYWYIAAIICCWLGMGSKEVMITAPVVVLLYDRIFLSSSWREVATSRGWVYAAFLLAAGWLLSMSSSSIVPATSQTFTPVVPDRWTYLCSQPGVILYYLRLCIWPSELCLDHMWRAAERPFEIVVPGLVVVSLIATACVALWRWPRIGFVGVTFFLILSPTSSIIPLHLAFEHRMYLPLACVTVLFVLAAHTLTNAWTPHDAERFPQAVTLAMILALPLLFLTWQRNEVYHSEERMWRDVISKSPNNPRAHANLANALIHADRYKEALRHCDIAISLWPKYPVAWKSKAHAVSLLGETDLAERLYLHALTLDPSDIRIYYNLGLLYADQSDWINAERSYRAALQLEPDYAEAHNNLGQVLKQTGRTAEARNEFQLALRHDPELAEAHLNLGNLLMEQDPAAARECYFRAIKHRPDYTAAYNNMGVLLHSQRDFAEAQRFFELAAKSSAHTPHSSAKSSQ